MRATILTAVVCVMLGSVAWSGDDVVSLEEAERLSQERQVFMKELGKSMRTIKGFLSGRNDAAEALAATGVLKDAATAIPPLFPPGTGVDALPRTGALDAIWENWSDFEMAAQLLGERAAMLETLEKMTFYPEIPVIAEIRATPDGFVWVQRQDPMIDAYDGLIDVFDPEGSYVGTFPKGGLRMPVAFGPGGLVAYWETDDMDIPSIVVYRLPEKLRR